METLFEIKASDLLDGESYGVAASIEPAYARLRSVGMDYDSAVKIAKQFSLGEVTYEEIRATGIDHDAAMKIGALAKLPEEDAAREMTWRHKDAAQAHYELFERSWLEYLIAREAQVRLLRHREYAAFRRSIDPNESPKAQLQAFQSAFSNQGVLNFWDWDKRFNMACFEKR